MSQLDGMLGLTPDNRYYALPDLQGKWVLEVGCNVGLLARHIINDLRPREYLGIDVWQAPDQTPELRERFRPGDIQRRDTLPPGGPWDVVICFDVLYHLLSPLEGLLNLAGLTRECLVIGTAVLPEGRIRRSTDPLEYHHVEGPVMRFEPGFRGDPTNYFFPTEKCLTRMLEWAGFRGVEKKFHFAESKVKGFCDRVCYHCRDKVEYARPF